jgi:predicted glutamine amidotransferase
MAATRKKNFANFFYLKYMTSDESFLFKALGFVKGMVIASFQLIQEELWSETKNFQWRLVKKF